MLKDDYFKDQRAFLTAYATRMPGSGPDGGAIPGRGGDYMQVTVDMGGQMKDFKKGYNIVASPVEVAWRQVLEGEVELVIRNTNKHVTVCSGIPDGEWFKAYFLPWNQGCVARMTLPAKTDVNYFFTAEMNGCSFVASGSPESPYVAHANVGDVLNVAERERLWSKMVSESVGVRKAHALRKWDAPANLPHSGTGKLAHKAPVYGATDAEWTDASAAFTAQMAKAKVKGDPTKSEDLRALIGDLRVSLMGVRDPKARTWKFFYQRNYFIQCGYTVKKLGWAGGLIKLLGQDKRKPQAFKRYCRIRGSEYIDFWPAEGPGILTIPRSDDGVDYDVSSLGL